MDKNMGPGTRVYYANPHIKLNSRAFVKVIVGSNYWGETNTNAPTLARTPTPLTCNTSVQQESRGRRKGNFKVV